MKKGPNKEAVKQWREKKHSKEVMNKGTLRGVLYMISEEAHLTLKEKKKGGDGSCASRMRP